MPRLSRSLFLALATTALTVATPALAKQHESAKPAAVADLVAAVAIPYDEFTLDNGLKVLVHTDRKAPMSASRCGIMSVPRTSPRERPVSRICSNI